MNELTNPTKRDKMSDKINRYGNYRIRLEGSTLIIEIETDFDKVDVQPSASRKSMVIATTGGAKHPAGMDPEVKLNLTLYKRL